MNRLMITAFLFAISLSATMTLAAVSKVEPPDSCALCGMSRPGFAKSRMLITYEDGSSFGSCSIACASDELAKKEKKVKSIQVGEYNSEKLMDARSAVWIINPKQRGIMSPVAKWAFNSKSEAEAYVKSKGGKLATWDEALSAAAAEKGDAATGGTPGCNCCDKKKK